MPVRLCSEPGCPELAAYRGRCAAHARIVNRVTHRHREIYGSKRWRILRRHVLFKQPLCGCGDIATDVHHVVDLADGGDPFAVGNLEALCRECHSRVTRARMRV